jgi:SAM-dependent methyltransferase
MIAMAEDIPKLFEISREYQFDPKAIDDGHTSATERLLYRAIAEAARVHFQAVQRPLSILDVCAASGGCANKVLQVVPCDALCLVDNERVMWEAAKARPWTSKRVDVVEADAVEWSTDRRFDLILMNSAYHHIENERKAQFMRNMAALLKDDGKILVGEHFLPAYDSEDIESYRDAVLRFYSARINELVASGDPPHVVDVIRQTGRYCWERRYEFQVRMSLFQEHFQQAGLRAVELRRLWPSGVTLLPEDSGTFLVVLGNAQTGHETRNR